MWFLYMASWHVRTLVDVEGTIETARQSCDMSVVAKLVVGRKRWFREKRAGAGVKR